MSARQTNARETGRRTAGHARGPFSRLLDVHEVPDEGLDMTIEADAEDRAAIAADAGIPAVGALAARYHIERRAGGRLDVTGTLEARITQTCVVSLEPFESDVEQEIALTFAPRAGAATEPRDRHDQSRRRQSRHAREGDARRPAPAPVVVPGNDDQHDPPDPIIGGAIDLGTVALEFLVLSLDLYPRKPGVHFADMQIGETDAPEPSPFAALERLKDRS